jgi:ATP-dependent DNA helicase RecG
VRWKSEELLEQLDRLGAETADDIESEVLELKRAPTDRSELKDWLVKNAVCLANQRGGCVLVGVADRTKGRQKAITGIGDVSYRGLERDVYDATDPHILVELEELHAAEGVLLAAHVPRGIPPHTTSSGRAWIRIDNGCVPLTGSGIARMISASGDLDLSAAPAEGATLGDLSPEALQRGRDLLRRRPGLASLADENDGALLAGLRLTTGSELTQAAVLLFGTPDAVRRLLPQHRITVLRYTTSTRFDRRLDLRGPLLLELSLIEDELAAASSVRTVQPRGFAQLELPTIDWEVAREAILNAVAHRDYFLRQAIIVALHKDRVEISSPGGFMGGVTAANILRHAPVHRNELLAETFQQLGFVDRAGVGVDRIYEKLLRVGARLPTYIGDAGSVSLSLPLGGSDEFAAWVVEHEAGAGALDLDRLILLRRLVDVGSLDRWAAAECLQLSDDQAAERLTAMRREGLLVVRGRGRGTRYELSRPLSERLRGRGVTDADHPLEAEGVRLRVLELLRERGRLTNAEIRDFSGYSRQQVLALEKALEREGLIDLHGHGRGAYIALAEDGNYD